MDSALDQVATAPPPPRVLVLGFGNPGRRDDGLGPALAACLEVLHLPGVTVESNYQLSIEDAESVARHDIVVFVDAATDVAAGAPFHLQRLEPTAAASCFSHDMSPRAVLQIAAECFGARPQAWLLGIRPADVESFAEGLTAEGEQHLVQAREALLAQLACWRKDFPRADFAEGPARQPALGRQDS